MSQLAIVLLAWLFVVGLHWQNDGLWFQGDSPRHAANGLFWKDFLLSGSVHPQDYALRYYARYPVIGPTGYPPVFYLLEAAFFGALSPSPYVAKGIVLGFALLAALYLIAWLRRWIAAEVGWAAALLLLAPSFVSYSHAIMLNLPSTALSLAALYHARRWIEAPAGPSGKRQLFLAAALVSLAILTYLPAAVTVIVVLAWLLAYRRWALICDRRAVFASLVIALLLLPWLCLTLRWSPMHVDYVANVPHRIWHISNWGSYLPQLPGIFGPLLLVGAIAGLVAGAVCRRWRHETSLLVLMFVVVNGFFSMLVPRDARQVLLLGVPIVCSCAVAFQWAAEWLARGAIGGHKRARAATLALALALCGIQAWTAAKTHVPRIQGFQELVAFLKQAAPAEPVFYDGYYDGVFTFYTQAGDPGYQRRVVLGSKLLYASGLLPRIRYQPFVASTQDVAQTLQARGGCRWLAIETSTQQERVPAARLLREAVHGPQFERVRSFPVLGPGLQRIDIYRFKPDLEPMEEADLPFPLLGEGIRLKARPIQR